MNYDKQKPLTDKEINYLNSLSYIGFEEIPLYPKNMTHIKILWGCPIEITRNEDELILDDKILTKENYWVVYPSNNREYEFNFKTKQFKNIKDALKYGFGEYKKWHKEVACFIDEISNKNRIL